MSVTLNVRRLNELGDREVEELSTVLVDCVEGGASVSFMKRITRDRAADVASGAAPCSSRRTPLGFAAPFNCSLASRRINRTGRMWRKCWFIDGRAGKGWVRLSWRVPRWRHDMLARPFSSSIPSRTVRRLASINAWVGCAGDIPGYALLPGRWPLQYNPLLNQISKQRERHPDGLRPAAERHDGRQLTAVHMRRCPACKRRLGASFLRNEAHHAIPVLDAGPRFTWITSTRHLPAGELFRAIRHCGRRGGRTSGRRRPQRSLGIRRLSCRPRRSISSQAVGRNPPLK